MKTEHLSRFSPLSPTMDDKSVKRYENDFIDRPYLPECWLDDKRMEVLFNPFRARDTNPEGWDLKMNFWANQINKWCLHQRKAVFTLEELRKSFSRGDQFPHNDCLKLVISHLKRSDKIVLKEDLLSRKNPKNFSATLWAFNSLIVKPVTFGWSLISSRNEIDNLSNEDKIINISNEEKLINKETLEILAESVESHLNGLKTTCIRYTSFLTFLNNKVFSEKNIDQATFDVLMYLLERKSKVRVSEDAGFKIVKFGKEIEIKETDVILAKLETTKEVLENEAVKLEGEIEQLRKDAKLMLENANREKALLILRRKKRLEKKLREKDNQIDNVEVIYEQLLEADSQQLVTKAFQLANEVLKKNTSQLVEVEDAVAQVEDTLSDIATLTEEVNRPIATNSTAFEMDAEAELEEMMRELEPNDTPSAKVSSTGSDILRQLDTLAIADQDLSTESCTKSPQPVLAD